jgi:hypothetical protein
MCFLECVGGLVRTIMRTLNELELLFACCLEVFANFERGGAAAIELELCSSCTQV